MGTVEVLLAVGLAAIHLAASKLRFLNRIPRSRWLSLGGGISVSYVFLHLLPELQESQEALAEWSGAGAWLEHHAYLIALLGLAAFYGLERYVAGSRHTASVHSESPAVKDRGVFALHMGSFAFYNFLVGYLLVHNDRDVWLSSLLYFTAMAMHFVVVDLGLRQDHARSYDRIGQWLLATAILAGFALGVLSPLPTPFTVGLTAFLSGGIILNVLKEELPEERQSRFEAFLAGAVTYSLLLLGVSAA